jgi:hypothetical protein
MRQTALCHSWAPKVHQPLLGETENKSSINAQQ